MSELPLVLAAHDHDPVGVASLARFRVGPLRLPPGRAARRAALAGLPGGRPVLHLPADCALQAGLPRAEDAWRRLGGGLLALPRADDPAQPDLDGPWLAPAAVAARALDGAPGDSRRDDQGYVLPALRTALRLPGCVVLQNGGIPCVVRAADYRPPAGPLAVMAIFKREERRLAEWLAWHRMVGVDLFLLYDNDDHADPVAHRVLAPYLRAGLVRLTRMPGRNKQIDATWQGRDLCNQQDLCHWLAFIDLDEFLTPLGGAATVPHVLARFDGDDVGGVIANWCCYGSSGHVDPPPLCTTGFTRRPPDWFRWNGLVKQINRPQRTGSQANPHEFPAYPGYRILDMAGRDHPGGAFVSPPAFRHLRVTHYYCRSRVEYAEKLARGFADHDAKREDAWAELDNNEVADLTLADRRHELARYLERPGQL